MAEPALPASIELDSIRRRVGAAGGFATLLATGSDRGSAMLIVHRRGDHVTAYEKLPTLSGAPLWRPAAEGESAVNAFVAAQRRFDPDLWVIELDIDDPARFVPGFPTLP